jgi:RNA polymerase sigma-70 factor, ECF subfamily
MDAATPIPSVTALLARWGRGDDGAVDALFVTVYDELRRIARRQLRGEQARITLQPTVLVHEAYMRLVAQDHVAWQNRGHFFAIASQMMRRIVVDHARRRQAAKRGGSVVTVVLDGTVNAASPELDVLGVDDALEALAEIAPRQSRIVEMRFFGGLSIEETAEALAISPMTVKRDWRLARAWLLTRLGR